MSDRQRREASKRERYLIDPRLQLALAVLLAGIVTGVALAWAVAIYVLPGEDVLRTMTAEETRALFLRASLVYYAIATAAVTAVAVFLSHRIAGPVFVIERALRGLERGDYEQRLSLRTRDYLKPLATSVAELCDSLREREERRQRLVKQTAVRLEASDLAGARELLAELIAGEEASEVPRG